MNLQDLRHTPGHADPHRIGVVIHQPDTDTLSFTGKSFNRPIDVELWKNITDEWETDRRAATDIQSGVTGSYKFF